MKTRIGPLTPKRITSMLLCALLVFSFLPAPALAEAVSEFGDVVSNMSPLDNVDLNGLSAQADQAVPFEPVESKRYEFVSGLPSESNVRKDLYVKAKYDDEFFAKGSAAYNDDLAYASACMAAAADNSNEWGDSYFMKGINISTYLSDIGCKDVVMNYGYIFKPMTHANIGVAIGYKDVETEDGDTFRLFAFGIRGGGYEEEWAPNMRLGAEGDAQGFQEARDGALGYIMPYIQQHTNGLPAGTRIKIWGSGYCRGGTVTNLVFGWLNKWVYERNNGEVYNDLGYTQSYNAEHSVYGDLESYSAEAGRYTKTVSFPTDYLDANAKFSNDDLYAYPVNCPFGADATDVENYEGLMAGIHNLINPDDWFPQLIMEWFGFKRYGYTQDHDITGTYEADGTLHARDKSVWEATSSQGPATAPRNMGRTQTNIAALDPNTVFKPVGFRQYYLSKYGVFERSVRNVGKLLSKVFLFWKKQDAYQTVIKPDIDEKGEGNEYYSKGKELALNQGAYYQEFMRFLLAAAGFKNGDTSAEKASNRKLYVEKYQDVFYNVCKWVLGAPLEARERFGKVASSKAVSVAKSLVMPSNADIFLGVTGNAGGTIIKYIFNIIRGYTDSEAAEVSSFIGKVLSQSMDELKIGYTQDTVNSTASALGKLALSFYKKEQNLGSFNFYHALTLMKGGTSIAQSHWPEQSLAWFLQFEVGKVATYDANALKAQAEGDDDTKTAAETERQIIYYDPIEQEFYDCGKCLPGDYIGSFALSEALNDEAYEIEKWKLYDFNDFHDEDDHGDVLRELWNDAGRLDEIQTDDPKCIVLVPEYGKAASRHVKLWLNKEATGFDKDVLIGEFDVYEGGYHYLAYNKPEYEFEDLTYYGENENLIKRTGVELLGWVNEVGDDEEPTTYLPDDYVSYEDFTDEDVDGGTINLYAVWYDALAYGVSYHNNSSANDSNVVEDYQLAADDDTLTIESPSELGLSSSSAGKRFAGWNTKADGSGTSIAAGDAATIGQLGLGDRETYLGEIEKLGQMRADSYVYDESADELDDGETLDEQKDAEADAYETELLNKYTVHLYAQWEDDTNASGGSGSSDNSGETQADGLQMWRLYNPNSGEHFYTASTGERDQVVAAGWKSEGKAWVAPKSSTAPVYRLYNPNGGDHHYTASAGERDKLVTVGWRDEGIGWYSDVDKTVPVWRQYNPNATTGNHNFTTSTSERNLLVELGWRDEGVGFYALA